MNNMVVGGLMTEDGGCASLSGATPMGEIAPTWYHAKTQLGQGIGKATVDRTFEFRFGLLEAKYELDVSVVRGAHWDHAFMMMGGEFEIQEALTEWRFALRRSGDPRVLANTTARGLLEFGATLLPTRGT